MSKRDKLMINEIGAVQPSAQWTLGKPASGFIISNGSKLFYWTPDGKPITPMQYREEATTDEADEIPF